MVLGDSNRQTPSARTGGNQRLSDYLSNTASPGLEHKASETLLDERSSDSISTGASWHSNAGVICCSVGCLRLGDKHFARALDENALTGVDDSDVRFATIRLNRGYGYLASGDGREAFECFRDACLVFGDRPVLWLRLSEACIVMHERHGYLAMTRCRYKGLRDGRGCPAMGACDMALYDSCIHAALFARHALKLERNGLEANQPDVIEFSAGRHFYSDVAAGAILVLAYIHLELHDMAVALEWAEALLAWPFCGTTSLERVGLAKAYAAEARAALATSMDVP
eukprot:CAMPEP_0197416894 /NCGR_PEP_ID=MMETSP1170-20131217/3076_1 /TAXON_ID=54406 /ORGANISM="Sarcinochrysis sp, Strain CCMP770" /LENGTH=282 /DNA_ID=CAMNT_0042943825 /DNA_START=359 /DNA_END=1207 /DNA_ORIENTATION=-